MEYTAHLLVVDDDVEIRELLAEVLQKFGFKVILAAEVELLHRYDAKSPESELQVLED